MSTTRDENQENQRITLSYLEALYAGDELKMASVRQVLTEEQMIAALSKIALVLAETQGLLLDPLEPVGPEYILRKLRKISYPVI